MHLNAKEKFSKYDKNKERNKERDKDKPKKTKKKLRNQKKPKPPKNKSCLNVNFAPKKLIIGNL